MWYDITLIQIINKYTGAIINITKWNSFSYNVIYNNYYEYPNKSAPEKIQITKQHT